MPSQSEPTFRMRCRRPRTATGAEPGIRPHTQTIRECRFARRIARTQSPVASAQILRCRETLPWGPPDPTRAPFPPSFLTLLNAQQAASVGQNAIPWRNIAGIRRNIGKVGSTYQKVDCACVAIRSASPVSCHSQRMPRIETRGSETMRAPSVGDRRATSDTTAMMTPDNAAFTAR